MKSYLENFLPRIIQFSQTIGRLEFLINEPWILIEDENYRQKYIFRRNGDLVLSFNGNVSIGKWEYLSSARALLLDRLTDKILLNQFFIDPALMVFQQDGNQDKYFIFANEKLLPDLNIVGYLRSLYYSKYNILARELVTGDFLEVISKKNTSMVEIGDKAQISESTVTSGKVKATTGVNYYFDNNIITRITILQSINSNKGVLKVEKDFYGSIKKGDLAYYNELPAPDGEYKVSIFKSYRVRNGKIS